MTNISEVIILLEQCYSEFFLVTCRVKFLNML